MEKKCKDCKDFDPLTHYWGKCKITGVKRDTYDEETCMLGKKLIRLKIVYTGKTTAIADYKTTIVEGYSIEEVKKSANSITSLSFLISEELLPVLDKDQKGLNYGKKTISKSS